MNQPSGMRVGSAAITIALLVITATTTVADTLTVTTNSDYNDGSCTAADCTLREAIAYAQPGDAVRFAASATGTITLTGGQLVVDKALTIIGPGARVLTISGNNSSRVFLIDRNITAAISHLTIANGRAPIPGSGGGIFNDGNLTLEGCRVTSNVAGTDAAEGGVAGGIDNYVASTLVMRNCEISYNVLRGTNTILGGGLRNVGTATLINCTVSNNQGVATGNFTIGRGMGIRNERFCSSGGTNPYNQCGAATLTLINSTVSNNYFHASNSTALTGAGIQKSFDAPTYLRSTIVAGNRAPNRPDVSTEGGSAPFNSQGYNLIGIIDGSVGWKTDESVPDHDLTGTAASPRDPGLAATGGVVIPTNNGGETDTHALLSTSPARDAADDGVLGDPFFIMTDQRGYPRRIGPRVDIGAFEFDPAQVAPGFVVTTNDHHDDGVCGIGDCSLLEAINGSNANTANNSTITFAPTAYGTIINNTLSGGMSVIRPVTISGPGADLQTVSGGTLNRIFTISSAGNVSITGLTLRDARGTTDGGAIRYTGSGLLTIDRCRFFNNVTIPTFSGGALYTVTKVNISNCDFGGNKGGGAGALYPRFGSVMNVTGCYFYENEAMNTTGGGLGGAILLWDGPTMTVTGCTFRNNKAVKSGGAAYVLPNSTFTVNGCTFDGNSITTNGGEGGAISNFGTLTLADSTLSGNSAKGGGKGGGLINGGTANLSGVTMNGNHIDGGGWGAAINNSATCTLTNVTLSGNSVAGQYPSYTGFGGGIYSSGGSLTLTNATLSGNTSGTAPGGGGGGIYRFGGTATLTNTAIAKGSSGENCFGVTGGDSNLSDDGSCGFGSGRDNVDLLLQPLANNGGPTATHLPSFSPRSPAIDNGTATGAPGQDQRGVGRPYGAGFDVGAVEFGSRDFLAVRATLANISTRLQIQPGDNALFAGFIVTGTEPKKVIVRALGPSLPVPGALADPLLEIYSGSTLLESSDNWVDSPNKQAIIDSTVPPPNDLDSAITGSATANGTAYTAIVRGVNNGAGIGLLEVYDLDRTADSKLANISTRGLVQTGDNVLIAGTIVLGQLAQKIIVRAIGPSLTLEGKLADPTLELRDQNGGILEGNDNWVDSPNKQAIIDSTIPPTNDLESAIVYTLPGGGASYTAIVRGANNGTGIAIVEIYALQ